MTAVLCAVTVSAIGNVVFVAWLGWGLVGAAVTTVATQYVCAAAMLFALRRAHQVRQCEGQAGVVPRSQGLEDGSRSGGRGRSEGSCRL